MNIINQDLTKVTKGIIVHQLNNKRVMGAGVARQIRSKYPQHYGDYLKSRMVLGDVVITKVSSDLFIIGYIGQDGYGRDGYCYTVYSALVKAFETIQKFSDNHNHLPIYLPYNMGCALAGGDWNIVSNLISNIMPNATVCRL